MRTCLQRSFEIVLLDEENEGLLKVEGVVGRKVEYAAVDIDMEVTVTGA